MNFDYLPRQITMYDGEREQVLKRPLTVEEYVQGIIRESEELQASIAKLKAIRELREELGL